MTRSKRIRRLSAFLFATAARVPSFLATHIIVGGTTEASGATQ